ncbi:MAG: heavy metal sensor histidine kinase [Pirellulaceae bacterium]
MARSLRWRLQTWHAGILALAIVGFGVAVYVQNRWMVLRQVDNDLLSGARLLEGTLKAMPKPMVENGFPGWYAKGDPQFDGGPPPDRELRGKQPGGAPGERPFDNRPFQPPERNGMPRPRPPSPAHWEESLSLPTSMTTTQGPDDPPIYFGVFAKNGQLLNSGPQEPPVLFTKTNRSIEYRVVDFRREVHLRGPENSLVIVGQDIRPQLSQLTWLATQLVLIGGGVLSIGLAGGWWMAGRAIKPIEQIHQTAARINSSNLSERINLETTDQELRELATILNSMLNRLEQSFEQQNRFTADASHELRTPLTVLLSHTELALSRQRTPAEYQDALATIQRAGLRMKALTEDLLVLARANAGKLELRRDEINLRILAEEAAKMFQPISAQRSITLTTSGVDACCLGDKSRISQIIANLLNNAIQYNHEGGEVEIFTKTRDGHAVLGVRDSGEGIPESELPRLFDPFYRVDTSRSRNLGGSGLGLAICKRIVDAHGGEIHVESQPQRGSTFEIRFPIAPD